MGQDSSLLQNVQTESVAHPASYSMATGEFLSPVLKHVGYETDHSAPPSA